METNSHYEGFEASYTTTTNYNKFFTLVGGYVEE